MSEQGLVDAVSMLEDAPCGLLRTDDTGLIEWANRTFCKWTGYEPHELAGARRLQDLFSMGGRIFHQTHWAPLLQMQGSIAEVKFEVQPRQGEGIPMILNAVRHERQGTIVQDVAMYVARDRDKYEKELVLSRRKLEEAVAAAQRLQEEARDRALFAEQMVGIVSHDLRNPLSAIHMGATLLTRTETASNKVTVLGRITRATDRANRLISDLLDFTQARIGTGVAVNLREVLLGALVHDAVDELAMAFADRTVVHSHDGDDRPCRADPDRLSQLMGNLVANAAAYGAPEKPITITSRTTAAECALSVHNFGDPIPPGLLAGIFQPMTRGDKGVGASGRSVGLGLYIVREIARAHGGDVAVESSAEDGTTFTAQWPRVPAPVA